jgi:hypothetical protein
MRPTMDVIEKLRLIPLLFSSFIMLIRNHHIDRIWIPSLLLIQVLLLASFVSSQPQEEDTFILCPLGQNLVRLEHDKSNEIWNIRFEDTHNSKTNTSTNQDDDDDDDNDNDTDDDYYDDDKNYGKDNDTDTIHTTHPSKSKTYIHVKPCWCITLDNQYPAFCPSQFDTCRIESGFKVTCLNLQPDHSANWWPFLSPLAIVLTCSLLCFCCGTLRGQSCRDYILLRIRTGRICRCQQQQQQQQQQQLYEQQLQAIAQRMQQRNPAWIRTLLTTGIERDLRNSSTRVDGQDPWRLPTRLELSTKLYHRSDFTAQKHSNNEYESNHNTNDQEEDEEEQDTNIKIPIKRNYRQKTNSRIELQELEHGEMFFPSLDDDIHSLASDQDGDLCVICFTNLKDGDRIGNIPCNHLFHVTCLKEWLKKKNECPLCSATSIAALKH